MLALFSHFIFGKSVFSNSTKNNNSTSSALNNNNNPPTTNSSGTIFNKSWASSALASSFSATSTSSSASSSLSSSSWKEKSLCFDLRRSHLELNHGEQLIASFFPIEDIKGNPEDLGLLQVTNLRLIWISCKKKRVNLSIGWRTVSLTFEQNLKDLLGQTITSLCVLTRYDSVKYEFVFQKMAQNSAIETPFPSYINPSPNGTESELFCNTNQENWEALIHLRKMISNKLVYVTQLTPMYLLDPFEVVFKVWQMYKQTHLFRHCRANLGSSLFFNATSFSQSQNDSTTTFTQQQQHHQPKDQMKTQTCEINKLPGEVVLELYPGITQVESKLVKYMGNLTLTNIRLVWVDEVLQLRNFSIPYIRIESVKSKQSDRIIIHTLDYLATSNRIEFSVQRMAAPSGLTTSSNINDSSAAALDQVKCRTKIILEKIQNLFALFKSKPKFGPESFDECLNYMSYLKPIEFYFDSLDKNTLNPKLMLENFGPEAGKRTYLVDVDMKNQLIKVESSDKMKGASKKSFEEDEEIERTEQELSSYGAKLSNYLNGQSTDGDYELIFSSELGLMVERPANDLNMERLWRLDL